MKRGHNINKARTKTYRSWIFMKSRCFNPNDPSYKDYGGRGINICERWLNFDNFLADMGQRLEGKSIDRINNNGNYTPKNCHWATAKEQNRNSRQTKLNPLTVEIVKKLLKESQLRQYEIADIFNVDQSTISYINRGKIWFDIVYMPQS